MFHLIPCQQPIIIGVRTDPEPHDRLGTHYSDRSITETDAHRINRFGGMNLFKLKAWVTGIAFEEPVGIIGLLLNMFG